ncbi:CoA-binding protein, partial [Rhodopirellula bahusiensis]
MNRNAQQLPEQATTLRDAALLFSFDQDTSMNAHNLDKIFRPRSVAVIGASSRIGSVGNTVLRNLVDGQFSGDVYPVNPKYKFVEDFQCFG